MQITSFKSFLILLMTILVACGKDQIEEETWITPDEPRITVESARMVTHITDETGQPVEGLTAAFNDTIRLVNKGSYFQFKGSQLNKRGEMLRLTDQLGRIYHFNQRPIENDVAYFHHVIIQNKSLIKHKSHQPLELNLDAQTTLSIASNQYRKSIQTYSGDVWIEFFSYDLTRENHKAALPGDVTGISQNGGRVLLNMVRAFEIQIKTPNAENLEFSSATLGFDQLNGDNALYYFNEKINNWEELPLSLEPRISINKSGYYCMAKAVPYIQLKGRLLLSGQPSPNQKVILNYLTHRQVVYTSNNGRWEALVPAGVDVEYQYQLSCFNQKKSVGASSTDIALPDDLATQQTYLTRFSGVMVNCQGRRLTHGFVEVKGSDWDVTLFLEDGNFDLRLPHCNTNDIKIRAHDAETGQTGDWIDWKPNTDHQVYNIFACDQFAPEYIEIHNEQGNAVYKIASQTLKQNRLEIEAEDVANADNTIWITFPASQQGIQLNESVNIVWKDIQFAGKGISVNCANAANCGFEIMDITHLPLQKDEWVRGHFKARFWSKILDKLQAGYVEVEGSFQFRRNF